MIKTSKILLPLSMVLLLTACSSYKKAQEILPNEQEVANQCLNVNKSIEVDCYDLIAYKNSIAQLRLGINAQYNGNFQEALDRYTFAQKQGNFYANVLIANIYLKGFGVEIDESKAKSLLKDTRKVDPIAAYRLAKIYLNDGEYKDALELLEFAGENGVKDAQKELSLLYSNGEYFEIDSEKSSFWKDVYDTNSDDFVKQIYGR